MNVFDEMTTVERKIAATSNIPSSTFDSAFFDKMEQIFSVGDYYFFTVNIVKFEVEFVHENMKKVLGYPEETFRKDLVMNQIHPDDVPYFLNFGNEIGRFFSQLPPEKVMKYKTRYDFRVKKANGNYIRILHQGLPIQVDKNGGMIRKLMIHTDITEYKKNSTPTLSFIGLDDEPSFIDIKVNQVYKPVKNILSAREKQILILLAEGKSRSDIADKLFVSKFTIDNHRKNMLEKTETTSVSGLISKAINEGWI
ncbi:LuxR C-terminal-related transcriptional regulator [Flavobacterium sp. SUN046]|uniref:LuxR C-terminal-related transcriptional regulator n=1 Tax=Flavobacterium sp. SUN046 TaxID=3002440 RepID=UPI002DB7363D|nr:LuxR C-terminal-related transcriptional regulator [Flavobacterium sp. SUN046]MEC4050477.1 LuxR C-terminal-related transcriptional regulator [Flavobacterium sp. SUN046]